MLPPGNWHRIHPAFGLRRFRDEDLIAVPESDLGAAWLAMSEEDRDTHEVRFFRNLLLLLATTGTARFEADPTLDVDARAIRAATGLHAGDDIHGALGPTLARLLPERNLEGLIVTLDDELVLVLHDGWSGVVVSVGGGLDQSAVARLF